MMFFFDFNLFFNNFVNNFVLVKHSVIDIYLKINFKRYLSLEFTQL